MWSKAPSTPGKGSFWSNLNGAEAGWPCPPGAGVASCAMKSAGNARTATNTNPSLVRGFVIILSPRVLSGLWFEHQDGRLLFFRTGNRDIKTIDLWHPE